MTSVTLYRYVPEAFLWIALLATTRFRLLPDEITAVEFVPFCAIVGGIVGAARQALVNGADGFPEKESFRGACYGVLFGFCCVGFGALAW